MEFREVRQYSPGDEVRSIDWNVTARMSEPYVRRYHEERELSVMLVVDASGSADFGSVRQFKRELARRARGGALVRGDYQQRQGRPAHLHRPHRAAHPSPQGQAPCPPAHPGHAGVRAAGKGNGHQARAGHREPRAPPPQRRLPGLRLPGRPGAVPAGPRRHEPASRRGGDGPARSDGARHPGRGAAGAGGRGDGRPSARSTRAAAGGATSSRRASDDSRPTGATPSRAPRWTGWQ